jgi:collagenase-like PrtC family protease
MKILSPVDTIEEIGQLAKAGADELYCGVTAEDWPYRTISVNRRHDKAASFDGFKQLAEAVTSAHRHGIPLFLTLNEHYCTAADFPTILNYAKKARDLGIDGLIVSDLSLILALRSERVELHVSTGGTTFNKESARFYQGLGVKRIVLPRHLTLKEMRGIVAAVPDLKMEAFILNSKCPYIDGLCTFHHGLDAVTEPDQKKSYRNACMLPYAIASDNDRGNLAWKKQHIWAIAHMDENPCGICALPDFEQIGIASLKIVGRGNPTARKVKDIQFLRAAYDLSQRSLVKGAFIEQARKLYRGTYGWPCRIYMCYYPYVESRQTTHA